MNIVIKCTNIDVNENLKEYVNKKIRSLDRFSGEKNSHSIIARVELAKTTRHHRHGNIYKVEVNINMQNKFLRNVSESDNIYKAIDKAKDSLKIMINDYKKERVSKIRIGARMIKKLKRISPFAWTVGKIKKIKSGKFRNLWKKK